MNSGAIFLAALAFNLQDAVFAQSPSSLPPPTPSQSTSGSIPTPSIASTSSFPSTSQTPHPTSLTPSATTTTSTTSITEPSTSTTTAETSGNKTCGEMRVTLKDKNARLTKTTVEGLFNSNTKYTAVNVSAYKNESEEEQIKITFTLCLVQGSGGGVIEDYFKKELAKVINASIGALEFEAKGVTLGDWKAEEGECTKCSEAGGGPFSIVRTCKDGVNSCRGVKIKEQSDDCPKYCDDSGRVTIAGSSLIVSAGIAVSLSLYLWK